MSPASVTLLISALALVLFVADFLPMGLVVFSVPLALYFAVVIEAGEIFAPLVGQSIVLVAILWVTVWALTQVMSNTATCALFCPISAERRQRPQSATRWRGGS